MRRGACPRRRRLVGDAVDAGVEHREVEEEAARRRPRDGVNKAAWGDDPGSGLAESGEEAEALGLEIRSSEDVRPVAGEADEPDHGVGRLVAFVCGTHPGVKERGRLLDEVGGRLSGLRRADEGEVASAAGLGGSYCRFRS